MTKSYLGVSFLSELIPLSFNNKSKILKQFQFNQNNIQIDRMRGLGEWQRRLVYGFEIMSARLIELKDLAISLNVR